MYFHGVDKAGLSLLINTFIPQVEEEKMPKVGFIFDNIEEALRHL